jgi:hypothetical protein
MNSITEYIYSNIKQFKNEGFTIHSVYIYSIILMCILYILTKYNKTIDLLNNENARIGLLILIGFISSNNIYVGFIMTLILLAIMQIVTYKNIDNDINILNEKLINKK